MIQFCVMSGYEGRIRPERKVYVTFMGGCSLKRSTVARLILAQRLSQREGRTDPPRQFFLTIMGGVEIKCPTLAEEFIDLREMINNGTFSMDDWDRAMADLGRSEVSIASISASAQSVSVISTVSASSETAYPALKCPGHLQM